jgi:membrane protein YdbS with pleckstrin-like domain
VSGVAGNRAGNMAGLNRVLRWEENSMGIILLVLLLALILGGLGFAIHILWWIALVVLAIWLIGFVVRVGEGTTRGRWYRW